MSKSQRVCQYWQSAEKSNASVALVTVSRFSSTASNGGLFGFAAKDT